MNLALLVRQCPPHKLPPSTMTVCPSVAFKHPADQPMKPPQLLYAIFLQVNEGGEMRQCRPLQADRESVFNHPLLCPLG